MVLAHLLEDLDEEADLDLSGLLQQGVQSGRALSLTQHPKPLLNGAELVLEVLVERGGSHLLQRRLILVNVRNPLLGDLVLRIDIQAGRAKAALLWLAVEVGRRPDAVGRRGP